ncbi:hypothetical protein FC50_GL001224 [Lacticaseibacillus pantheris DSM 15945 = JCM 12539 = NBRC 106106]|uniref:Uncharacterized protein n=1 Tax=Lacticaseibacillus pantheris DSM 15945 = JCM 12539 = NBRC 106106 TaxID=1423783 RepID=A0A0R1U3K1_9LACO|nr:PRD domain-containing protein [Lacticaseibacillus pantheris]KRL85832.1 hypothetical protein FC50_GL001224 [Lacticaseibacillus pantheris DSM 15945 = JCM 12539 = NBRC 106106]
MKQKLVLLIRLLMKTDGALTSRQIATELNISTRTVRNYVHEINGLSPSKIIDSSDQGYQVLDRLAATELLRISNEVGDHIPQNDEERYAYIVKKLLRSATADIFDLANELYVSYQTLRRTIQYSNQQLAKWSLTIVSNKDRLSITGAESSKRQLFSHLIYRENTGNLLSVRYLEEAFGKRRTSVLQYAVDEMINKYNLNVNEFAYNNLLLHLLILIARLSSGNTVSSSSETKRSLMSDYTEFFITSIEHELDISISNSEATEIEVLIKSNANIPHDDTDTTKVDEELRSNILTIAKLVRSLYMVDLSSNNFVEPFTIHVHNLVYRIQHEHSIRNPIRPNIRNNFPLIFDIATYVAFQIGELWNIHIPEDETAFIALHIGAEIERQKHTPQKLRAILIAPNYLNLANRVHDFLRVNFSRDITIIQTVEKVSPDYDTSPYDVVFTSFTNDSTHYSPKYSIELDPFNLDNQKSEIQDKIDRAFMHKKKNDVRNQFFTFFEPKLFWHLSGHTTKDEVLKPAIDEMRKQQVVNDNFYDEILERESMGSTSFKNIAIPHPMSFNSPKTKVAVILNEDGITWDGAEVNMVYIISISEKYKDEFRSIYENLMDFLSDDQKFKSILESRDLNSFYERLLS